jgi:flagellar basal body-associated protein FliL
MDTTLVHQQAAGLDMEGRGMNDDDDDEDMLVSLLFTVLTVAVVLFVVGGVGITLWSLLT